MFYSGFCVALVMTLWGVWIQIATSEQKYFDVMGYQRRAKGKPVLREFLNTVSCHGLGEGLSWCELLPPTDYAPPGSTGDRYSVVCTILQELPGHRLVKELSC